AGRPSPGYGRRRPSRTTASAAPAGHSTTPTRAGGSSPTEGGEARAVDARLRHRLAAAEVQPPQPAESAQLRQGRAAHVLALRKVQLAQARQVRQAGSPRVVRMLPADRRDVPEQPGNPAWKGR